MKRFIGLLLAVVLAFAVGATVYAEDTIRVALDGKYIDFDVPPQIIDGRTMVPIRGIFEKMGAQVNWDSTTATAICTKGETVVKMTVGSKEMYIDNQVTEMDVPPVIADGRTLAPARYVAEAFGANVGWSEANRTVVICSADVYAYADYPDIPDLGKCYDTPLVQAGKEGTFRTFTYAYSDKTNEEKHRKIYADSALVLGGYTEVTDKTEEGITIISYTKQGETEPRYYVGASYNTSGDLVFVVMIPDETDKGKLVEVNAMASADNSDSAIKYYRTPTGKKYHIDPECGGENSYIADSIADLTPCKKCVK